MFNFDLKLWLFHFPFALILFVYEPNNSLLMILYMSWLNIFTQFWDEIKIFIYWIQSCWPGELCLLSIHLVGLNFLSFMFLRGFDFQVCHGLQNLRGLWWVDILPAYCINHFIWTSDLWSTPKKCFQMQVLVILIYNWSSEKIGKYATSTYYFIRVLNGYKY